MFEHGQNEAFVKIPKEWLRFEVPQMGNSELKIVLYVMLHTWGYGEFDRAKAISIDEFMHGRLTKQTSRIDSGTGLSRRSVLNGIKNAVENNFLIVYTDNRDAARVRKYYMPRMNPFVKKETFAVDPETGSVTEFSSWLKSAAPIEKGIKTDIRYFKKTEKDFLIVPRKHLNLGTMSSVELRVFLYLLLHTWGYREFETAKNITLDEFEKGRLNSSGERYDPGTGLSRKSIIKGLREALENGRIAAYVDNRGRGNRKNKYYIVRRNDAGITGETCAVNPETGIEVTYEQWLELAVGGRRTDSELEVQKVHPAGGAKGTLEKAGAKSTPGRYAERTGCAESTPGDRSIKSTPGNRGVKSTPGTREEPLTEAETARNCPLRLVAAGGRIIDDVPEPGGIESTPGAREPDARVEKIDVPGVRTAPRTEKDTFTKKDTYSTSTYGTYAYEKISPLEEREDISFTSLSRSKTHKCDVDSITKSSRKPRNAIQNPTNKDIIAELTGYYRSINGIKSEPSDFAFIGRLYNEYGYDRVLWAIHKLGLRIEGGNPIQKPKIYMMAALRNGLGAKPSSANAKSVNRKGANVNGQYQRYNSEHEVSRAKPEPGTYRYQLGFARDAGTGQLVNIFDLQEDAEMEHVAGESERKPEPGTYRYQLGFARDAGTGEIVNIYDS